MPIFDAYRELPAFDLRFDEMPTDRKNRRQYLWDIYMREDVIRAVAHRQWERDGCPDGEEQHRFMGMKLRDVHWLQAKLMMETVFDMDIELIEMLYAEWAAGNEKEDPACRS